MIQKTLVKEKKYTCRLNSPLEN